MRVGLRCDSGCYERVFAMSTVLRIDVMKAAGVVAYAAPLEFHAVNAAERRDFLWDVK
jgi:hypothetical protein